MENKMCFPSDCEVVGRVPIFENSQVREDEFYVKGYHPELASYGSIDFVQGKTGPETKVSIVQAPSEYFYG